MTRPRSPRVLRWLAALLIRGPEAAYIRVDLDDAFEHDVSRGLPLWRARQRYGVNVFASTLSVWSARVRPSRLGFSLVDVKLGIRMLVKYPGLTCVAVFALAIGIPVGLGPAQMVQALEAPLPVDEGDRIHMLRYWNTATLRADSTTVSDFRRWSDTLTSFETIGAVRTASYNLGSTSDESATVAGAAVTASTFDMLRTRPLLGRRFVSGDEDIGAPAVAVLGYDLWQSRFVGDADIVGRIIQIGGLPHTVVGVMPKGFLFPIRQQLWLPLRERSTQEPRHGLPLTILGRLVDAASADDAQAELTAVGLGMAADFPDTYERLQPEVVPSAFMAFGFPKGGLRTQPDFYVAQVLTLLPLLIACVNVGLLIFARTSTRSSEFAVRTALGASRARVISQVFTESLVLAVVSAGVGLLLIGWLPGRMLSMADVPLPYWVDLSVTRTTILWAFGLAVLSAAAAGVVPALMVTGRSVHQNIQRAQAKRSGARFGGLSSALIVADVAIAVVAVGLAAGLSSAVRDTWGGGDADGIQADQFLSAQLRLPPLETEADADADAAASDAIAFTAKVAAVQRALVERLKAEPGVRAVAVGNVLPRMDHPIRRVDLDGETPSADGRGIRVRTATVDLEFFDALQQPILSGRGFTASDLGDGASTVIVNTTFVEQVLDGGNPIGRRVRYRVSEAESPGPWYEIVGVVGSLGMHSLTPTQDEGIYHPLVAGSVHPVRFAIQVSGVGDGPEAFAPRLRALATEIDPRATMSEPIALSKVFEGDWYLMVGMTMGGVVLIGVLLTLAASGIYALLSFAVTERTREIGIRIALGADRSRIALTVGRRALMQLSLGVLLGMPLAGRIFFELFDDAGSSYSVLAGAGVALLLGIGVMGLIGLVACTAPMLRALRIAPTEALKNG